MAILRPYLAIFCQLYVYLSQKRGSDGQLAEKWPEMVVKWAFVIVIHLDSEYNLKTSRPRVAPLPFRPCSYLMTLYIFIETWLHRLWYSISIASPLIETLRYQAILVMLLKVIHNSYHNRAYKLLTLNVESNNIVSVFIKKILSFKNLIIPIYWSSIKYCYWLFV